jgi:hypothetical protein
MKMILSLTLIFLFIVTSFAQSQTISKEEYDKVFRFAVTETNADYPLIFKVTTNFIEAGKIVRTEIELNENEARGQYRIKRTIIADGNETNKYQISYGGNVYCSDDSLSWTPPSRYECPRSIKMYGSRDVESVEYSVTEKISDGKKVKVYREYTVYPPLKGSEKKEFEEKISTIDSCGFFINIVGTEGTLDPKTVTLTREQVWTTKAKFKKIVPPDQN